MEPTRVSLDSPGPASGTAVPQAPAGAGPERARFGERLLEAIGSVDRLQKGAEAHAEQVALGEGDLVKTMVTLSKADLALRFVVNVRNRALEAYQEIMRLPL